MQYRLTDSLGLIDARYCNQHFAAGLPTEAKKLAKGEVIELNKQAADYLSKRFKSLLEPAKETVKAVASEPAIKGVTK